MRLPEPPLLVITDRSQARRPIEDVAEAAFRGGCRWLSLREKDLPAPERLDLLRRLMRLAERFDATVGVHDDVEAAHAARCGAIHLPDGASIAAARARLGGEILIGISAHSRAGIAAAAADGADYATLSPIFASASKPGYGPALGPSSLAEAAGLLPVLALGGIDDGTVAAVIAASAGGIAVMGEAMRADDPERAVAALVRALAVARNHSHSRLR